MKNTRKHTTEIRLSDWAMLPWFLNGSVPAVHENFITLPYLRAPAAATPAQRKRVLELITKLNELASLYGDEASYRATTTTDLRLLTDESAATAKRLQAELNQILAKYPMTHVVDGATLQDPDLQILPQLVKKKPDTLKMTEATAIRMVLDMANLGVLHLLKRCGQCGLWFVASRRDRLFCTEPCKRKYQQSSPEFKAKRNADMRERYAQQKLRASAAIRAFGGKPVSPSDQRKNPNRQKKENQTNGKEIRNA